ncbi:hypothetical protein D3C73_1374960 [compost metagenome]
MMVFKFGDGKQLDKDNHGYSEQQQKFSAPPQHLQARIHHPDTEQANNQHRGNHRCGRQRNGLAEFPEVPQHQRP